MRSDVFVVGVFVVGFVPVVVDYVAVVFSVVVGCGGGDSGVGVGVFIFGFVVVVIVLSLLLVLLVLVVVDFGYDDPLSLFPRFEYQLDEEFLPIFEDVTVARRFLRDSIVVMLDDSWRRCVCWFAF